MRALTRAEGVNAKEKGAQWRSRKSSPEKVLAGGTDFRFFDELKRELKTEARTSGDDGVDARGHFMLRKRLLQVIPDISDRGRLEDRRGPPRLARATCLCAGAILFTFRLRSARYLIRRAKYLPATGQNS
jgi:hypothetical protein